ncbi:family 10 glycosylhydrolase, partial [bacterium]|nr:family 10 glycosylhydrolase [bacterium]
MIDDAKFLGVKDLFIQVHRGNRAWFDSSYADLTPYKKFINRYNIDPIKYIIEKAGKNGINVHLWINVFRIKKNLNAPIVKALGTKIFTRDGRKRLIIDYPKEDLPDGGYWLDPGDLQVQDYLLKLIDEAITKYPACAGVHLDFVRYPYRVPFYPGSRWAAGHGFGYGVDSVNRFKQKTGLSPFTMKLTRENAQLWDNWRRGQVTSFVSKVKRICAQKNKILSTACICWADRAYLSAFQDWRRWLEDGLVNFVSTMNYSTDNRFVRYLSREAVASKANSKVYIGLGAYLLTNNALSLAEQIDDALSLGADGVIFFSYDVIKPNQELMKVISNKSKNISR